MRALQLDPDGGGVQPWAQTCFYVCTFAVLGQTVLVVLAPLLLAARVEIGEVEGDATFEVDGQVRAAIGAGCWTPATGLCNP